MSTYSENQNKETLPAHIGIIMDGNGRWAKQKKKPRTFGHEEGLSAAKRIVTAASELGIPYLTLYTFSTENWKRSEREVGFLMKLISVHLRKEFDFYRENRIRVKHSGDLRGLPEFVCKELKSVVESTSEYDGTTVNLAINYGGRDEIIRGVNRWIEARQNTDCAEFTGETLKGFMDIPELPDADLIIRTGGEVRLSNFLLWQSAYSELYFSDKLWPDWNAEDLHKAIKSFSARQRRYGGVP